MPITFQEIGSRALAFSREWKHAESEDADAKSFWDAFFEVFGVSRRRVASFEKRIKKIDGKDGYIDLLWKGTLLVEHKSRGKDLDRAYKQATDYFPGLKEAELPRYVLVSDFARFRLYDLDEGRQHDFALKDLHKKTHLFGFIAGYRKHVVREQDPINVHAVQQMGYLHDALKKDGYAGHALEHFLVRLMFCLFADDTGIFQPKGSFRDLIENWTSEDGATVETAAQGVFDEREAEFKRDPAISLATLYDPDLMAPALVKAHQALDRAVDAAYVPDGGKRKWASDAERVAFLFRRYREITSLLPGK